MAKRKAQNKRSGGEVKVIACIEDPAVVKQLLDHLEQRSESITTRSTPPERPLAAAQRDGF